MHFEFLDCSFVCEASNEDEKYKWMLMLHFAKSRYLDSCQDNKKTSQEQSDILINATHLLSDKSNKAVSQFFEKMENGKVQKKLTQ